MKKLLKLIGKYKIFLGFSVIFAAISVVSVSYTHLTIYFVVWRLQSSELKDWITFREEGGERDAACISE